MNKQFSDPLVNNLFRLTPETLPTSTRNSLPKYPRTRTSKVHSYLRPCSSNSRVGHTIDQWLAWETRAEVSEILHSAAFSRFLANCSSTMSNERHEDWRSDHDEFGHAEHNVTVSGRNVHSRTALPHNLSFSRQHWNG